MFSLIYVGINDWVNNREAGDLRCYQAHCDVIVMVMFSLHTMRKQVYFIDIGGLKSSFQAKQSDYQLDYYQPIPKPSHLALGLVDNNLK